MNESVHLPINDKCEWLKSHPHIFDVAFIIPMERQIVNRKRAERGPARREKRAGQDAKGTGYDGSGKQSNEAVKDFYSHDQLRELTKELSETLRKNRTIDWQKKDSARAGMRLMVKKLLRKYKYRPEGLEDAVKTVIAQCEMWTDEM